MKILLWLTLSFSFLKLYSQNAPAIVWQRSLGGSSGEYANSIKQCIDGGFIIAGESLSSDGDVSGNKGWFDCWIVKLDASGSIEWQKTFGGSSYDYAFSAQQTTDGGYVFAGTVGSSDGDVIGERGSYDYWI